MSTDKLSRPGSHLLNAESTSGIVGYRLRRAQLSVFQRFLAVFDELDLRPAEYAMLLLIADNPGRRQNEIADALGIKHANFVGLVQGFDGRGLIERRPAAGDRRAKALYLTPEGSAFLARAHEVHDRLEASMVAALGGESERDILLGLLDRLS
ncbi:MAG: MarR family winged helix-turn-helix transcriptional regulator [Alphaproteobacteria bacterium]|nr:MarR family winged helix-turn-helix transcriptional regulator [Alphaproteobacteria bacterium]